MPSIVRLLVAALAGIAVLWLLASGAGAQSGTPGYPMTQTAQAASPTPTPVQPSPTATPTTGRAASQVVPANATAIAGDRGRIASIRANAFIVLWTTDASVVGQVNYGASAALGSTAVDGRGPAFSGRTHFVEILGLAANTVYFFDLVSGGQVDNNGGQHYQIKTGPDLTGTTPPSSTTLAGQVLNPGGVAPAGGALVWALVRDGNGQGTGGASQLLGALAGGDGRFSLLLQPRTADLSTYFVYSNEGDAVDVSARGDEGAVDMSVNTAVTQGGTQPGDVRLVLAATPPAAGAPTPTPTPAPSGPTPAPTNTPVPPVAPTAAPTPLPPTAAPAPAPVQLPPMKDLLLQAQPPYPVPGGENPAPPAAEQPAPPAAPPPTQPPPTALPAAPIAPTPSPVVVPPPTAAKPVPTAAAPPGAAPAGALPAAPATAPPVLPQTGPAVKGPGGGAFGTGQAPSAPRDSFGQAPAPVATPGMAVGPLTTLANLPPLISALFYGGIVVVAIGAGLAIWSILSGTGWRPR